MTALFIPSVLYLLEVHRLSPLDRAYRRKRAQRTGITVEQFRNEELEEIEDCFLPDTRFLLVEVWRKSVKTSRFGSKGIRR